MIDSMQVGAIGVQILVTVLDPDTGLPVPLSSATKKNLIFQKPDGTETTFAGSFLTDGSDGNLQYVTAAAGDVPLPGQYSVQLDAIIPAIGYTGRSTIGQFYAKPNL